MYARYMHMTKPFPYTLEKAFPSRNKAVGLGILSYLILPFHNKNRQGACLEKKRLSINQTWMDPSGPI